MISQSYAPTERVVIGALNAAEVRELLISNQVTPEAYTGLIRLHLFFFPTIRVPANDLLDSLYFVDGGLRAVVDSLPASRGFARIEICSRYPDADQAICRTYLDERTKRPRAYFHAKEANEELRSHACTEIARVSSHDISTPERVFSTLCDVGLAPATVDNLRNSYELFCQALGSGKIRVHRSTLGPRIHRRVFAANGPQILDSFCTPRAQQSLMRIAERTMHGGSLFRTEFHQEASEVARDGDPREEQEFRRLRRWCDRQLYDAFAMCYRGRIARADIAHFASPVDVQNGRVLGYPLQEVLAPLGVPVPLQVLTSIGRMRADIFCNIHESCTELLDGWWQCGSASNLKRALVRLLRAASASSCANLHPGALTGGTLGGAAGWLTGSAVEGVSGADWGNWTGVVGAVLGAGLGNWGGAMLEDHLPERWAYPWDRDIATAGRLVQYAKWTRFYRS